MNVPLPVPHAVNVSPFPPHVLENGHTGGVGLVNSVAGLSVPARPHARVAELTESDVASGDGASRTGCPRVVDVNRRSRSQEAAR